jgi:flagellar biosynthesis/type III secretory pathway protein FliH
MEQGRVQGLEQGRAQGLEQGRVQGLVQGLEEGRVQGLEQGRIQQMYQNIELIVRTRFPALLVQAKRQVERLNDLATLQDLLITVATATEQETEQALRTLR